MTEPRDPQHDADEPWPDLGEAPDAPERPEGEAWDAPGSPGSADAAVWGDRGDGGKDADVPGAPDLPRLAGALRQGQPGEQAIPARVDRYVAVAAREYLEPIRAMQESDRQCSVAAATSMAADGDVEGQEQTAAAHRHRQRSTPSRPRSSQVRRLRWRIGVGAGLAGAAVLALAVVNMQWLPSGPRPLPAPAEGERVTILDAFALARALEAGRPVEPGWDFTGDGQVGQRDVHAIANRAVAVADRVDDTQQGAHREGRES